MLIKKTDDEVKMIDALKKIVVAAYALDGDAKVQMADEIQVAVDLVARISEEKLIYDDFRLQWIEIEY